ncbi:hypothetical protein K469DRAFT_399947 [Zopfia rhizophila CBS 207.26]|uniref:Zn(2)-C6 fungal-type domain-containing protein n=1 Tax=Zopfia rhizophila CBS 207.26 TaxID=1314779 RepID=A0A6A6DDP2_9PEZI|nr:hypothetical protein K469DRAFT_399947 [Zopfia rhizophila CBS 207.26]
MASKYDGRGETPMITRRRHVLACARCRARRVKCDRAQPVCSNCSKASAVCQPAQQRSGSPSTSVPHRPIKREAADNIRLSKLEEEVTRLSHEVDSHSPAEDLSLPSSPVETSSSSANVLRGVVISTPQPRYFSPYSWVVVSEELADVHSLLGTNKREASAFSPTPSAMVASHAHPEASVQTEHNLLFQDEELSNRLVQLYIDRVDPLIRILHLPSFLERFHAAQQKLSPEVQVSPPPQYPSTYFSDPSFIASQPGIYPNPPIMSSQGRATHVNPPTHPYSDPAFRTLLLSVYYAALISAIESPDSPLLGKDVDVLAVAARYKREAQARMSSPELGRNNTIEMLQALVIMLSVEHRSLNPRAQWLRLGVATRMAQEMGLHRDGSFYGFRPVDIEVRRRVWAHICMLDVRFAEELGCEPAITTNSYDTRLPLSISDEALSQANAQDSASGQEAGFKHFEEITKEQQRKMPFSPMTCSLVGFEAARVMAKLLTPKYLAEDSIFSVNLGYPSRRYPGSENETFTLQRVNKSYWVGRLENRFKAALGIENVGSDPMQIIALKLAEIHVAKARFVIKLQEWKDGWKGDNGSERQDETKGLFNDAINLTTRIIALINHSAVTPYAWYLRRLNEVYACSFLLMNLASPRPFLLPTDIQSAWSNINQLFPISAGGVESESYDSRSALGRLLIRARKRREQQWLPTCTQSLREQAINAAAGGPHNIPSGGGPNAYQAHPGNLFEDLESIMQDPLWAPVLEQLPGVNDGFGTWVCNNVLFLCCLISPYIFLPRLSCA